MNVLRKDQMRVYEEIQGRFAGIISIPRSGLLKVDASRYVDLAVELPAARRYCALDEAFCGYMLWHDAQDY
jgi:hypothetical protein